MWRSRSPPTPLDYDSIMDGSFDLDGASSLTANAIASGSGSDRSSSSSFTKLPNRQPHGNGNIPLGEGLRDQRALSLKDNLELFVSRCDVLTVDKIINIFTFMSSTNRLASRLRNGEDTITFDKDDDDALDFVTASSNLRSFAYGIDGKTRWEIKGLNNSSKFSLFDLLGLWHLEMAGNIIPAIATTNAIVSGLIVLQALHLLKKSHARLRNVHLQFKPAVPLSTIRLSLPNPECGVCRDTYAVLLCDPSRTLLGDVVKGIMGGDDREVSVYEDKRVLSDPDWEDNFDRTLESLNVTRGNFLTIVDEEGEWSTISLGLGVLP